jgi:hypothetical protein
MSYCEVLSKNNYSGPRKNSLLITTDYRTIEIFALFEGILAPNGRKSLPEGENLFWL